MFASGDIISIHFIWGGILSVLWSEILFYSDVSVFTNDMCICVGDNPYFSKAQLP